MADASSATSSPRTGAGAVALRHGIGTERADLERHEVWCRAGGLDISAQLALKHGPREHEPAVLRALRHDVGDERPGEPRSQRGSEIARLIGVRKEHQRRRRLLDHRPQCGDVPVGRVLFERGRIDGQDLAHGGGRELLRRGAATRTRARRRRSARRPAGAAAIASQLARFNLPCRCSATTRIIRSLSHRHEGG